MPGGDLATRLISAEYLAEQKRLHRSGDYGRAGDRWVDVVVELVESTRSRDVLDYGCGKGALGRSLIERGIVAHDYDPAIEGKEAPPKPADLVVCTDVLEHIEPERIDAVIEHLYGLTMVALFVAISTRLAGKHLSDGRNAHVLLRSPAWWRSKMETRFRVKREWGASDAEWVAMLRPREVCSDGLRRAL